MGHNQASPYLLIFAALVQNKPALTNRLARGEAGRKSQIVPMPPNTDQPNVPVEFVFNPNWWFRNYGISFDRQFYFDKEARIANDVLMRRALYERFGLGEPHPQPRPVIGSMHVAGGFVVPALLGVEIRFAPNEAPWQVSSNLSREHVLALKVPELESTWPMNELIRQMDSLREEFGYVVGDVNTDGVLNTALQVRGQQLFVDMLEDVALVEHLFAVVAETQASVLEYLRQRTGTCSVAVNRSILNVDPTLYIHPNCSVQMISPALFQQRLLPCELLLARRLRPYGVHHCGNNTHLFAHLYAQTGARFLDVGWGSDVSRVRATLPQTFLNLRLSPMRMLNEPASTIREDVARLLAAAGDKQNVGVCCINMDYGTPDGNVRAVLEVASAERLRPTLGAFPRGCGCGGDSGEDAAAGSPRPR